MSKQIIIDYEEYLELEEYKKVIQDLGASFMNTRKISQDPLTHAITENIYMPQSFKSMFGDIMNLNNLSKVILDNEREKTPNIIRIDHGLDPIIKPEEYKIMCEKGE